MGRHLIGMRHIGHIHPFADRFIGRAVEKATKGTRAKKERNEECQQ